MGDHHRREAAGFFCRWALLAGAAGVLGAVAWAGLLATVGVTRDAHGRMLLRDWVARPAESGHGTICIKGHIDPQPPTRRLDVGLLVAEGHGLRLVRTDPFGCVASFDNPQRGTVRLAFRGLPYSSAAFQAGRCTLLCAGPREPVFFVDARMALQARTADSDAWRDCLERMEQLGRVALFHPGPHEQFLRCAERLRALGVTEPVLYDDRRDDPMYTIARAGAALRAPHPRQGIEVVTADRALALRSGGKRFVTHLVADDGPSRRLPPGLTLHGSIAKFKDFLTP